MRKSRGCSAKLNMLTGLTQELVAVICGLILPRVILLYFGSTYNGLVNSVVQFMGFSTVLRSGLGAVTHAALYKPLAEGNKEEISGIMVATRDFMRKVGLILALLILGFALIYPFAVQEEFDYFFSFTLILIIGLSTFMENMFSVKYKILLQADQKYYIQTICTIVTQVLSTVVSVVLIVTGNTIHIVRLGAALAFATTPLMLNWYVKKNYDIDWSAKTNRVALKQRWDAFAHQLATIANNNVGVMLMSVMLTMKDVSIYSVYYMVVNNIHKLASSTLNGLKSTFGDMMVRGEKTLLKKRFQEVEWAVFAAASIVFSITAIMLTSFVMLYTSGVEDVNYHQYWLGIVMVIVHLLIVLRIPYQMVTDAAGHFKQTRNGAILEVVLNVVFSMIFVYFFGVIGIVIGNALASLVRTVQYVRYANRNIVDLSMIYTLKNVAVYISGSVLLVLGAQQLVPDTMEDYGQWVLTAIGVSVVCSAAILLLSVLFNRDQLKGMVSHFLRRKKI